jgi:hypothetical protein
MKHTVQAIKRDLTADRLRELLHYDPATGIFTRIAPVKGCRVGDKAGSLTKKGYIEIGIDNKVYYAHRLAWLFMTGEWPPHYVDHREFQKADNRWETLRNAPPSESQFNRRKQRNNTSGYKGVFYNPRLRKWQVSIGYRRKTIYVGVYETIDAAAEAYKQAALKYHGEYAHYDEPSRQSSAVPT